VVGRLVGIADREAVGNAVGEDVGELDLVGENEGDNVGELVNVGVEVGAPTTVKSMSICLYI